MDITNNPRYLYNRNSPIKRHNTYIVPCVIYHDGKLWPVYPNLHNDKESGQNYYHYHVDTRFLQIKDIHIIRIPYNPQEPHAFIYKKFKCQRVNELYTTNVGFISNTKAAIKYSSKQCVNLNKCPHKGFDLSNINIDEHGYKTCPLHGFRIKIDLNLKYK